MSSTPSTDDHTARADASVAAVPHKAMRRVLLVEDDPIIALMLEEALLRGGAGEVVVCATMQATLHELEKPERPDALILDVHLADRDDGWALAELVTLLGPKPPRIVFSTGSPEDIPAAVAGMGPVFEKPYDPDELVKALIGDARPGFFARLRGAL